MHPDSFQLYCNFLRGRPGCCVFTQQNECHAFITEDEIEATYGSRHDGHHFVWLDAQPDLIGFVSDEYIDEMLSLGHIVPMFYTMNGFTTYNRAGLKAAVLLGAARMCQVLALPSDAGQVMADTIDTLPLCLRWQFTMMISDSSIPHAMLIEKMIPLGATVEDGEARGRLLALARTAVGANLSDIEQEAGRWADWAAQCTAWKPHQGEGTTDPYAQIFKGGRSLQ